MELLISRKSLFCIGLFAIVLATTLSETEKTTTPIFIPCKNNGTRNTLNNSTCICIPPWTGDYCTDYSCVHGLSTGDNFDENSIFFKKRCVCEPGYTGEVCDIPINNPCGSHGTFSDGACICKTNYTGMKCENVKYCLNGQLSNGRCSCHYGWTSDFCNKVVCHEGSPDESGINCTCKPKHRGRFCDFCTESESTPFPECAKIVRDSVNLPKEIFIAAGAILIIICIGLFILAVILRRMRRKSRRRHNSSDSYDFEKRYQLMNRANDRLPYEN